MVKQTIILGGGCFWCTEAIFRKIAPGKGVHQAVKELKIEPGYAGGTTISPTYEQVCSGKTGHAEALKIEFDEKKVPLNYLLEVFFKTHDPTTLNYQGNDYGTQYRSIILYTTEEQKKIIEKFIKESQKDFNGKIVTEVKKLEKFYPAENYNKNYYENNKNQPYCRFIILPKLEKFEK